jgi:hypothetical protein
VPASATSVTLLHTKIVVAAVAADVAGPALYANLVQVRPSRASRDLRRGSRASPAH